MGCVRVCVELYSSILPGTPHPRGQQSGNTTPLSPYTTPGNPKMAVKLKPTTQRPQDLDNPLQTEAKLPVFCLGTYNWIWAYYSVLLLCL